MKLSSVALTTIASLFALQAYGLHEGIDAGRDAAYQNSVLGTNYEQAVKAALETRPPIAQFATGMGGAGFITGMNLMKPPRA